MTTQEQVTHPPVTHPETITPAVPSEAAGKPAEKPTQPRSQRGRLRMPPPKVIAAVVLVVAALELLLWQVAGVFWGVVVHVVLALVGGLVLRWWLLRRRRQAARGGTAQRRQAARHRAASGGVGKGRSPLARLFGRGRQPAGGKGAGVSGARSGGGLIGRKSGGGRSGLLGRLTGAGRRSGAGRSNGGAAPRSGRSGGLLGRLARSTRGRSGAGRSAGTGPVRSAAGTGARSKGLLGRLRRSGSIRSGGGVLGRLTRSGSARSGAARTAGPVARRSGLRSALGRMRTNGRGLLGGQSRTGPTGKGRSSGGLFGGKPTPRAAGRSGGKRTGPLAGFLRGFRQATRPAKKSAPQRAHTSPAAPAPKPQPARNERLVKEEVRKAAAAKPAPVIPHARGGNVSDMNKIRSAADEFAAALKEYDPETMHQLVREMPGFAEALHGVSSGLRQIASRAESEWPVAGAVVEALRSMAQDVTAGAGTAEEARGTLRRENEADIERGEAPRKGSIAVERKWNVD